MFLFTFFLNFSSPKKKNKKKSKLADVDLQPFMEVEKKVEKLPPAPVAKPVETAQIPSTSAPVEAEPANSDGAEDQDGQEEGVPKVKRYSV